MENLPSLWILKHKINNEAGLPIRFDDRKFMWDMYNDMSPLQVTLKPPQIGATVKDILKSFWVAKKLGKDIIYCVDTETQALSKRGWLLYNELTLNDEILTLTVDGVTKWAKVLEVLQMR